MRFGTYYLLQAPPGIAHPDVVRREIEQMVWTEELGFDSIWLTEHHFIEYGLSVSPAILATAAAMRTQRVRIGLAAAILPFHDPIRLAEELAMVDILSGGRLDVGVGRGNRPVEFSGYRVPQIESRERFEETLEVLLGAWTNERFAYRGRYVTIPEVHVNVTITTMDAKLARLIEPYAPRPELRMEAVRALREAGIAAGVSLSPLLPLINPQTTSKYGLEVTSFVVENVSVPSEVEQAIDKRSSMAAVGNLNDYVKFQMAQGLEKGDGGAGGMAAQMAVGMAMAQQMVNQPGGVLGSQSTPGIGVSAPGMPAPELLTPAQVAQLLNVAESDVVASLEKGDLKGKQIGTQWRVPKAAVDQFLHT